MPRDDDWNQCSVVDRVPKSTAQNNALVATGQLGKLFVFILGVVFTDGQDAERDHRLAKRSPTESVAHFPTATEKDATEQDRKKARMESGRSTRFLSPLSPGALLHWLGRLQAVRRVPLPPRSY